MPLTAEQSKWLWDLFGKAVDGLIVTAILAGIAAIYRNGRRILHSLNSWDDRLKAHEKLDEERDNRNQERFASIDGKLDILVSHPRRVQHGD
jgi:hypothetical protein